MFQGLLQCFLVGAMIRQSGQGIGRRQRLQTCIVLSQPDVFLLDLSIQASNRTSEKEGNAYAKERGAPAQADVKELNLPGNSISASYRLLDFTLHYIRIDLHIELDIREKRTTHETIASRQILTGQLLGKGLLIGSDIAPAPEEVLRKINQGAALSWCIGQGSSLRNSRTQCLRFLLVAL